MQIFKQKQSLIHHLEESHLKNASIGFVPTMGALHEGHLSLVKKSLTENTITVVSIFINPTQFDKLSDLEKYPVTIDKDLKLLKEVNCDLVYIPDNQDIYGDQMVSENFNFGGLQNEMEGAFRKGHFNGVGTVVKKLFNIVKPTRAYFGEKDFQQLQIVRKLVEIEDLPIEIIGCPVSRESNGLAMSSRNERLTKEDREEAGFIFKILELVQGNYQSASLMEIQRLVQDEFKKHPTFELEYFSIADEDTLKTVKDKKSTTKPRAFIATYVNSVRLIDNLTLSN